MRGHQPLAHGSGAFYPVATYAALLSRGPIRVQSPDDNRRPPPASISSDGPGLHRLALLRILTRTRLKPDPVSCDQESSGGLTTPLGPYSLMNYLTVLVTTITILMN